MVLWCSFCQKFIAETEPVEDVSITHGICKECKEKPLNEETISHIKPSTLFFNELTRLKEYGVDFQRININAYIARARSLGVRASDLYIGIIQPVYTKLAEEQFLEHKDVSQSFNDFSSTLAHKIMQSYNLLDDGSSEIICVSSSENYPYGSIRFLEVFLRQENISPYMLPVLVEDDFMSELNKFSPKIIVFSIWSEVYIDKILKSIEHFAQMANPPLVIFDFTEKRRLELPPFAVGFNGDIDELLLLIRSRL